MPDNLLDSLTSLYDLNMNTILLNNLAAVIFALFIMFSYRITYSGAAYSRRYNVTLGMITIITTLIMCAIGGNVALSLGLVGALSIIRFRTAVKDVRDAGFIFWCIAIGVSCGVSQYMLAAISSLVVFLFMLVFRQVGPDSTLLLVVKCERDCANQAEAVIAEHFVGAAKQIMKSGNQKDFELIYRIRSSALSRANKRADVDIILRLVGLRGLISANLVEQTDDISR